MPKNLLRIPTTGGTLEFLMALDESWGRGIAWDVADVICDRFVTAMFFRCVLEVCFSKRCAPDLQNADWADNRISNTKDLNCRCDEQQ